MSKHSEPEKIFKSNDIRGVYGKELTEEVAYDIGRAFVDFLRRTQKCRVVAVGRDVRKSSDKLFKALTDGIREQGADVIDLGYCSTPMSYFGTCHTGADAGVMITASHLPEPKNGFKLSRANAVPVAEKTGLEEVEAIVNSGKSGPAAGKPGKIRECDVSEHYAAMIRKSAKIRRPVRIVADMCYAMGIWESEVFGGLPLEITPLYGDKTVALQKHNKPKIHAPDPLEHENMADLSAAVRAGNGKYDFGVMFDYDADRVGFVDEKGDVVPLDIMAAVIAREVLKKHRNAAAGYDVRASLAAEETIREAGGKPFRTRVGHAHIKAAMRARKAECAGEMSGHFYFKHEPRKGKTVYGESSSLAVIHVANALGRTGGKLSEMAAPVRRYFASGERNIKLESREQAAAMMERVRGEVSFREEGWVNTFDGLTMRFPDWWFNLRCSNTEAMIRLNVESTVGWKHMMRKYNMLKRMLAG